MVVAGHVDRVTGFIHDVDRRSEADLALDHVRAAVDDFGGDFSVLSSLIHLPFDTIKLGHDLIRFVETSDDDRRIVQLIVELSSRHDLVLMATGIETEGQLEAVSQLGFSSFRATTSVVR